METTRKVNATQFFLALFVAQATAALAFNAQYAGGPLFLDNLLSCLLALGLGLLLALHEAGYAGPLLVERQQDLSAQVRQLIMLSPAQAWSVSRVAKMLFLGESTLRRRLQQESQSFRQIVEEVRMAHALGQLQTTSRPIGEIAQNSGYQSGSRFTARFRQHYGLLPKHVR